MVVGGAVAALILVSIIALVFVNPSGAKAGDTVAVFYTGTLDDGTQFDSNIGRDPLVFVIGQGRVIQGMEEAVIGMTPGSTKTVTVPVEKAYGPYRNDLVHVMDRSLLPSDIDLVPGNYYQIRRSDGAVANIKVVNVTESTVTLDENHELVDKDLMFTITLSEISR
ncbi:MAG TPA: peptidylprolyl isomerase [Methanoregula sp.]|nr:peptidylprolyl isomerase [Methanoregula sp.]